ncbi:MAG: MgtC/SapB family protein [Bacteroidales bacterium]|nr:MgtC/SapB family protein [Bacteroidales bacterium]
MEFHEQLMMLAHIVLASVLAGIIGIERERLDKPAGIRTHMIVAGATAFFVFLGEIIVKEFIDAGYTETIRTDPTRIIQAIVVGISFIGAGTVLQVEKEHKIRYLTTAATILMSTGIGIGIALKQYCLTIGVTIFVLFVNYLIRLFARKMEKRNHMD